MNQRTVTFGRSMKDLLLHCFCMATSLSIMACCSGARLLSSGGGGVGVTTADVRAVSSSCCFFIFFSLICSSERTPTGQEGKQHVNKLAVCNSIYFTPITSRALGVVVGGGGGQPVTN